MLSLEIIGNLTRDAETRTVNTANGQQTVTSFTLAVNDRFRKDAPAQFFRVSAWGKLGEIVTKYTRRGTKVYVRCNQLSAHPYTTRDGQAAASIEATAAEIELLGDRRSDADDSGTTYTTPAPPTDQQTGFAQVTTDELPF